MSTKPNTRLHQTRKLLQLGLMILSLGLLASGCILIGPGTGPEPNNGGELVVDTCPASHPNDCGDFCCPGGTVCDASGVAGARCRVVNNNPDVGDIGDSCDTDDDCARDLECLFDQDEGQRVCTDE